MAVTRLNNRWSIRYNLVLAHGYGASTSSKGVELLRRLWAPEAFCVSFKILKLIKKAQAARERYDMHAVVANELEKRKQKVIVVTSGEETMVEKDASQADVEIPVVEFLVAR